MSEKRSTETTDWLDQPVSPRVWSWLLFTRVDLTLWAAPMLIIFSAILNDGRPGEFSEGAATAVALLWGMAKFRKWAYAK